MAAAPIHYYHGRNRYYDVWKGHLSAQLSAQYCTYVCIFCAGQSGYAFQTEEDRYGGIYEECRIKNGILLEIYWKTMYYEF